MTQTIEQLTARVRELEEENARLGFALADTEALELGTSERLAASQAYAEQLQMALEAVKPHVQCDPYAVVIRALSLPRNTSALDAYVAEKVKEAISTQKEYYESVFQDGSKRIATLAQQRDNLFDLAVEALEKLKGMEPADTALETIKESEK